MMGCPVCNSEQFDSYGGRQQARCMSCGALERGRLSWIVLEKLDLLRPGVRMLNMAPEPFMLFHGAKAIGNSYRAADYDPDLFSKWKLPVAKLDLCEDLIGMAPNSLDVIMHNHVLEHIPCDVSAVLANLNRLLVPGGVHLFSAPILPGRFSEEDLNPILTPEERRRRFGQGDHLRIFGDGDFMSFIERAMPLDKLVDLSLLITEEELETAALSPDVFKSLNGNRVFAWRK